MMSLHQIVIVHHAADFLVSAADRMGPLLVILQVKISFTDPSGGLLGHNPCVDTNMAKLADCVKDY